MAWPSSICHSESGLRRGPGGRRPARVRCPRARSRTCAVVWSSSLVAFGAGGHDGGGHWSLERLKLMAYGKHLAAEPVLNDQDLQCEADDGAGTCSRGRRAQA